MPRYTQKITRLMEWPEFSKALDVLEEPLHHAFLTVLYLSGCRISEALALRGPDVLETESTINISFKRLKGSRQTEPTELPRIPLLFPLARSPTSKIFPFSRTTGYRLVKRAFPKLYPHYFRMNRLTKVSGALGDLAVYSLVGITANALDHYRGAVSVKRVGVLLQKEVMPQ